MILGVLAIALLAPSEQEAGARPIASQTAISAASDRLRVANAAAATGIAKLIAEAPAEGVVQPQTLYMPVLDELYPADAKRADLQGLVRLRCTLTATGTLEQCAISVSSGVPSLDARSFEVARFARYSPRIVNRRPEASQVILPVRWVLQ